ncbi:MAG: hypothetical protein AAB229_04320 [Candidatus Hydrogenedentota bacterium]
MKAVWRMERAAILVAALFLAVTPLMAGSDEPEPASSYDYHWKITLPIEATRVPDNYKYIGAQVNIMNSTGQIVGWGYRYASLVNGAYNGPLEYYIKAEPGRNPADGVKVQCSMLVWSGSVSPAGNNATVAMFNLPAASGTTPVYQVEAPITQ